MIHTRVRSPIADVYFLCKHRGSLNKQTNKQQDSYMLCLINVYTHIHVDINQTQQISIQKANTIQAGSIYTELGQ